MAPSLASIKNENQKQDAILRRLKSNSRGLGFWAAVDALKYMGVGTAVRIIREAKLDAEEVARYLPVHLPKVHPVAIEVED